jgi:hypothetical protein
MLSASARAQLLPHLSPEPTDTILQPVAQRMCCRLERAWGAGLVRRFYGPSVLRRRHSARLGHLSWLALPRFGHGMGMRLGSGQAAAVWRSTGAIMGNVVYDFLLFSCMALVVTGIVLAAASLLI